MILTQRQLEQLLKTHGSVVVPYRARLTPMAADWMRQHKVTIGYAESPDGATGVDLIAKMAATKKPFLRWSDGPDGVAKAAMAMAVRDARLEPMPIAEEPKHTFAAIKHLNRQVRDGHAAGGILLARNAGLALILANKAGHLRAVVAGNLTLVEEAIQTMAANVLVVQRDQWSLTRLKNLLVRFCRADRRSAATFEKELAELNA